MAVPKKKNKKVKYKYSIIKNQYLNNLKHGVMYCMFCNLKKKKIELLTSNIVSKKKICFTCNLKIKIKKKKYIKKK